MIDAEVAQKLVELKFYTQQYDLTMMLMRTAKTQQESVAHWKHSNELEAKYLAICDWLTAHGYAPIWNKAERRYEARQI